MAQGTATKVKKRKKSVLKRAKQSHVRAAINRAHRTRVRSVMKGLRAAIASKDANAATNLLRPTMAAIDRAISKGILKRNTGNRYKSRLSLAAAALRATPAKA